MTIGELMNQGLALGLPQHEVKRVMMTILDVDDLYLLLERSSDVNHLHEEKILRIFERRSHQEPLQYILGEAYFYGRKFMVEPGVLIPRDDTERLVEKACEIIKEHQYKNVLDLCSGSGIIGLTIAMECENTMVTLADIDDTPMKVSKKNRDVYQLASRVSIVQSDLFEAVDDTFDIICSNPPYIHPDERGNLDKDVVDHEPHLALFGGDDGLFFYRKIIENAPKYLNENGVLIFEIGHDQGFSVKLLMEKDFNNIQILKDYAGHDRVVLGYLREV